MPTKDFKTKIGEGLKGLNRAECVAFAWCCGVRALPILGHRGNFDFWKKEDRQKYIYAVLYALDAAYTAPNAAHATAHAAAYDAANAANAAANAADATQAYAYAAAYVAADAAHVAYAAHTAATADVAAYAAAYNLTFYSYDRCLHDAADTAAYAAAYAAKLNIDLESILLSDLNAVRQKGGGSHNEQTNLYGEIWDRFQGALNAEGCGYWGRLYQTIFDQGLTLDKDALKRRMNVPKEIRAQGAAAVGNFLEEIEAQGAARLNEARIIILGEKGAGKTCIARRLIDPHALMTKDDESTAGVDTTVWKLEKEKINVRIWDFAGHTVTHAVHQFFLSERCLYLIVYDGRTEERNRLTYWLDQMKNYGGDSKAIILVNSRDKHPAEIAINTLKAEYAIVGVYTFSVQDDSADLEKFRNDVAEYIKNNPSWKEQEIPQNYYWVKNEIENLFGRDKKRTGPEYITREAFDKIAEKHHVRNVDTLLHGLHSLGVSLWYEKLAEYKTMVLNPTWISDGVYQIINWVHKQKRFALTLDDFATAFKENLRYPRDQDRFLFELMKHYELAYETKSGTCLMIPHLLQEDQPETLPNFPVGESLMLQYKADQSLPPHSISRFIVQHHQEIKKGNTEDVVWRYGVVLGDGKGSIALVMENNRLNTISVKVMGQDRKAYFSALRETLDDIFNSYKSKKPNLQYRIEHLLSPVVQEPVWVSEEEIQNHQKANKPAIYISGSNQDIPTQNLTQIFNITNYGKIDLAGHDIDSSTHNTFNFHDCNITLQGQLNDLAGLLTEQGNKEEAKELEAVAHQLEQSEKCEKPEEIKKSGIANRLGRWFKALEDEHSSLNKAVKGVKNGVSIAQDIAKSYNAIAQWAALPQVPTLFLK